MPETLWCATWWNRNWQATPVKLNEYSLDFGWTYIWTYAQFKFMPGKLWQAWWFWTNDKLAITWRKSGLSFSSILNSFRNTLPIHCFRCYFAQPVTPWLIAQPDDLCHWYLDFSAQLTKKYGRAMCQLHPAGQSRESKICCHSLLVCFVFLRFVFLCFALLCSSATFSDALCFASCDSLLRVTRQPDQRHVVK